TDPLGGGLRQITAVDTLIGITLTDHFQADVADGGASPSEVHSTDVVAVVRCQHRTEKQQGRSGGEVQFEGCPVSVGGGDKMPRQADVQTVAGVNAVDRCAKDVVLVPQDQLDRVLLFAG